MQTHYLPSNPATLTRTLMPEQHIGMMNVHIRVGLALWSGQKDELDDKHVHKCGHHPNYSLKRSAGGEEWEWMKGASMVVVVWGGQSLVCCKETSVLKSQSIGKGGAGVEGGAHTVGAVW